MATTTFIASSVPASRGPFTLARGWSALVTMVRARHSRRVLAEMDDRLLADIGIGRGDAQTEASRPFWDVASR